MTHASHFNNKVIKFRNLLQEQRLLQCLKDDGWEIDENPMGWNMLFYSEYFQCWRYCNIIEGDEVVIDADVFIGTIKVDVIPFSDYIKANKKQVFSFNKKNKK